MAESENQKANQKVWTLPEGVGSKFFIAGEIDYNIRLEIDDSTLHGNMQTAGAAFDAWALIFHTFFGSDIKLQLALKSGVELPKWPESEDVLLGEYGHYNRFLYRLMKFNQVYGAKEGWFTIADPRLSEAVARFEQSLGNCHFFNNVGDGEAKTDSDSAENLVEALFADQNQELLRKNTPGTDVESIYRKLPVGLFKRDAAKQKKHGDKKPHNDISVFPGGGSQTDLWGLSSDKKTLVIYELKTTQNSGDANKSVGVISELMFYCNYVYDMYIAENNFSPLSPKDAKVSHPRSGYLSLLDAYNNGSLTDVQGYILTDGLHPLITSEVLAEMSKSGIQYQVIPYKKNGSQIMI